MNNQRSILGVLALLALLFLPTINVHAQGAGNGDLPDTRPYTHDLGDGSNMAQFINMSSADQESLIHDYGQLHQPVPLGLIADSEQGQYDGGYGDASGCGTGGATYTGSYGFDDNYDLDFENAGAAPDVEAGGATWDPEEGCLVYNY